MPNTVICSNCGAEVVLPEHGSVMTGMSIGRCDGNSTFVLPTVPSSQNRIAQLQALGVDTSNYFSVNSNAGEMVAERNDDGSFTFVNTDEVERGLFTNGYIRNTRLHRRWVMAQMFRALHTGNYDKWLQDHGYKYQWKATLDELYVMMKIEQEDMTDESYSERSNFFTREVVLSMMYDYMHKLRKMVAKKPIRHCHGMKYKRIYGRRDIYLNNLNIELYNPLEEIIKRVQDNTDPTYMFLYKYTKKFVDKFVPLAQNTKMSNSFVTAYKGSGAYYTLKNMILYHNVHIISYYTGEVLDYQKSYEYIKEMNTRYKGEGWRMFALLKKTIEDNNFTFGE